MDYTIQEIRPLIYKDRKDIDCFDINGENSLDAEMLRRIEMSDIIALDGADKYILDIFNNAYYITTLIMMEKHPLHYFRKYITIAEHTGSAYYDIGERNTFYKSFSVAIMAMVTNYLRILDEQFLSKDNYLLKRFYDHFDRPFDEEDYSSDYFYFTVSAERLGCYRIDKQLFEPRIIDAQAINDAERHFKRRYSSWDKMITECACCSKDDFINALCKSDEEKKLLNNAILKDEEIIENEPKELGEAQRRIRELEEKLNKQEEENNSLKERIKELEEKGDNEGPEFEKEELAFLDDWQKLTTREFAIFFSQALGVSFNPKLINQQQLANLVAKWTEPKPDTIRTKIGNLFQEETKVSNEQLDSFSQKTKDEAMNVYMYILKVAKYYSSITPKMHTMLDNIEQIYGLNIDEERKKKIFETIEKERNSGK